MRDAKRILLAAMLAMVLGGAVSAVMAQAPAAAPAPVAAPAAGAVEGGAAPPAERTTFGELLKQGGWFMFPLGLLSVGTIALAVYGFMIVPEKKMLTPELVPQLQDALNKLHMDDATGICNANPSLLTNILNAGLQRISDGVLDVPAMEKAMEEASVEETSAGLKIINYLSIIAQIAPMIGLLGTVWGMIGAFDKIGQGGMGRPELLADDIGQAMVTTAAGLIIGIPAMFLYFHLKGAYNANVTRLGRVLGNLSHSLVAASRRAADGGADESSEEMA
jgi:biopolymer transport protein ExbB